MTVDEMEHLSTLSSIFFVGMWKYTLCSLQDQTHYGAWNFYLSMDSRTMLQSSFLDTRMLKYFVVW